MGLGKRQATDSASLAEIVASHEKKQKTDDEQEQAEVQPDPKQATQEQTEQPPSERLTWTRTRMQVNQHLTATTMIHRQCLPSVPVKQDAAGILESSQDLAESCFKTMSANDREHLREICETP